MCPGWRAACALFRRPWAVQTRELALYEGRSALSEAHLLVLAGADASAPRRGGGDPGQRHALAGGRQADLARGGHRLGRDRGGRALGDLGRDPALRAADRPHRRTARPRRDRAARAAPARATTPPRTRWSRSAAWAPTPSSRPAPARRARRESDPGLASRASDEPFVSVRFGCDDAAQRSGDRSGAAGAVLRRDALAARPSAGARWPGAARWRSARARCCSPPARSAATRAPTPFSAAIERLAPFDIVTVIVPRGEPEAIERARLLALRQPGRVAVLAGRRAGRRALRARRRRRHPARRRPRSDRASGRAWRCSTAPSRSSPTSGANHDYLVDYDPASRTGQAILYSADTPFEIESGVRRALTLRADGDVWAPLVQVADGRRAALVRHRRRAGGDRRRDDPSVP